MAGLVGPRGTLELLLAPAARDGLAGVPTEPAAIVAMAAETFERHGFELAEGRPATDAEVVASGSTWARRLGAGHSNGAAKRVATLVRLVRPARR